MNLAELHAALRTSPRVAEPAQVVASGFAARNLSPLSGVEEHFRGDLPRDELDDWCAELVAEIKQLVGQTNLTDDSGVHDDQEYRGLVNARKFADGHDGGDYPDLEVFVLHATVDLLGSLTPGIDEYVENLSNLALCQDLGLEYDDEKLIDVTVKGFEVRDHALIVPGSKMIYPHQFMRRCYSANFVGLPSILNDCIGAGLRVKLRIDPLRGPVDPKYYQEICEKDLRWGQPFSSKLLESVEGDRKERIHYSREDQLISNYPVGYTIFRSWMLEKNSRQRQFSVEEYVPPTTSYSSTERPPGFGDKYHIQKFAHFVYDQKLKVFNHLDGAIKVYTIEDYVEVYEKFSRNNYPEARLGVRHKLFLVEGNIALERVQQLLYQFFMYNHHLSEYFSAS